MSHPDPIAVIADRSTETRRVVTELLRRIGASDTDGIAALFADEFDWRLSWPADELGGAVPWIRPRRTRRDVASHFEALAAFHAPHPRGTSIERVLVDDADAVVLGTIRNVVRHSGVAYEAGFALHLTIADGRIVRYHIYEDSLSVWRAITDRDALSPPAHQQRRFDDEHR